MSAMPRKRRLAVKASSVAMGQEPPFAPQKGPDPFYGIDPFPLQPVRDSGSGA